jgi:hypothetical protein
MSPTPAPLQTAQVQTVNGEPWSTSPTIPAGVTCQPGYNWGLWQAQYGNYSCIDAQGNTATWNAGHAADLQYQQSIKSANALGGVMLAAAVAALFLLDGSAKLLALPLAWFGLQNSLKGFSI